MSHTNGRNCLRLDSSRGRGPDLQAHARGTMSDKKAQTAFGAGEGYRVADPKRVLADAQESLRDVQSYIRGQLKVTSWYQPSFSEWRSS